MFSSRVLRISPQRLADKLSAYLKCVEELKAGNTEFKKAKEQTHAALCQNPSPALIEDVLPLDADGQALFLAGLGQNVSHAADRLLAGGRPEIFYGALPGRV